MYSWVSSCQRRGGLPVHLSASLKWLLLVYIWNCFLFQINLCDFKSKQAYRFASVHFLRKSKVPPLSIVHQLANNLTTPRPRAKQPPWPCKGSTPDLTPASVYSNTWKPLSSRARLSFLFHLPVENETENVHLYWLSPKPSSGGFRRCCSNEPGVLANYKDNHQN